MLDLRKAKSKILDLRKAKSKIKVYIARNLDITRILVNT